jgi:hypothetical protein
MAKRYRFEILLRLVMRSGEVATTPGMAEEVTQVYSDVLAPAGAVFCTSHEAVAIAQTQAAKKALAVEGLLAEFDAVYRAARSVVLAYEPATTLPDTLKAQPTYTDALCALTTLVKVVKVHAGETWADKLSAGRFGTLAPKVEMGLTESISAGNVLAVARQQRANAYVAAYDRYLAFKRVVRDALGSSSVYYRKLNPRGAVSKQMELADEEAAPDSGVMPASNGSPALAGGSSPVKVD